MIQLLIFYKIKLACEIKSIDFISIDMKEI
jgi:hypothetical protein